MLHRRSMGEHVFQAVELAPLSNQVAGHVRAVQSVNRGELIVKQCLAREVEFYRHVMHAVDGRDACWPEAQVELLRRLYAFMPRFHGSWDEYLLRQGVRASDGVRGGADGADGEDGADGASIVLENVTYGYVKPNVCDIKLGAQLWDEDASEHKRRRMEEVAASTTSASHGIRLTGWQTYDVDTAQYHSVSKTFGKTIQSQHLDLGMRMLLATPQHDDAQRADAVVPGTSICQHGTPPRLPSLPVQLVAAMLQRHLVSDLEEMYAVFSEVEVRMRGASLLLVYEGDPVRLGQTLEVEGEEGGRRPRVCVIDFGHATLVPGEGPDRGVLLGISTVLELARRQLRQLELQLEQQVECELEGKQRC